MYRFINEKGEHLHTLDGKPLFGTSTVTKVIAKPLTWWASGLAVGELGWIKKADPRKSSPDEIEANARERHERALGMLKTLEHMTVPDYVSLLDKAYRAHADSLDKSADKGTDMHAELEKYVKECLFLNGAPLVPFGNAPATVLIFASWAVENVKRFLGSEGHCYSERLWTGGITDCIFEDKQGRVGIMDFKSSREAYFSQFVQTGGYDIEISENGVFDAEGNQILKVEDIGEISFYAVFPFGAEHPEPQFRFDTAALRKAFEACVTLHKVQDTN